MFNQGSFSEESTFLLSDWLKHTPPSILEKNLHLDSNAVAKLPKGEPLYIFPSDAPSQTHAQDRAEAGKIARKPDKDYTFKASKMSPTHSNARGEVKIVDARTSRPMRRG